MMPLHFQKFFLITDYFTYLLLANSRDKNKENQIQNTVQYKELHVLSPLKRVLKALQTPMSRTNMYSIFFTGCGSINSLLCFNSEVPGFESPSQSFGPKHACLKNFQVLENREHHDWHHLNQHKHVKFCHYIFLPKGLFHDQ